MVGDTGRTIAEGLRLHQAGQLAQAELLYRKALRKAPRDANLMSLLGGVCISLGRPEEGAALLGQVIAIRPAYAEAYEDLGRALFATGRTEEAIARLRKGAELAPSNARVRALLGEVHLSRGELDLAETELGKALSLQGDLPDALCMMGKVLTERGRLDDALAHFEEAMALNPKNARAYFGFGEACLLCNRLVDGQRAFERVIELAPQMSGAHVNLGNAHMLSHRLDEALVHYGRGRALNPSDSVTLANIASVYREQGRWDEALATAEEALAIAPTNPDARYVRAVALLAMGDYLRGFLEYEARWLRMGRRNFTQPRWGGEALPSGSILLHAEQGMGDTLHFVRFADRVKELVGAVYLQCPAPLAELLATQRGVDSVFVADADLPDFDVHAPLLDVPSILKTTLDIIPNSVPYLHADSERTDHFRRLLGSDPRPKVGLCWRGNPSYPGDFERSFSLAEMAPLFTCKHLQFVSLQKGSGEEDLAKLASDVSIVNLARSLRSYADTAALIKGLDLVISCDTSVAHLTGALAVPLWMALRHAAEWRWGIDRQDCPWYPTARLFRQPRLFDWRSLFEKMALALTVHFPSA